MTLNKMDKWTREAEEISPETEKIPSYKEGGGEKSYHTHLSVDGSFLGTATHAHFLTHVH